MNKRTRILAAAAAAALIVACNGAARAAEPPAILAFYLDGELVSCVRGTTFLADMPFREDTSDPRTRWEFIPARTHGDSPCPGSIPERLSPPANVSAVEEKIGTSGSEEDRTKYRAFIFGAGKLERDRKPAGKQGY